MEYFCRLIEIGLKVITGSDSSRGEYRLGNTEYEAECLVMAGYSSMRGVLSVTSEAAADLGIDDVTGTLEPGKEAGIAGVDGNPAEDVKDLLAVGWGKRSAEERNPRGCREPASGAVLPGEEG